MPDISLTGILKVALLFALAGLIMHSCFNNLPHVGYDYALVRIGTNEVQRIDIDKENYIGVSSGDDTYTIHGKDGKTYLVPHATTILVQEKED